MSARRVRDPGRFYHCIAPYPGAPAALFVAIEDGILPQQVLPFAQSWPANFPLWNSRELHPAILAVDRNFELSL